MEKGLSYTYPVAAFPRIKYLQGRLLRLTPRWQRILDGENLPDCVFQGRSKEKKILSLVDDSRGKVTVNLFVESSVIESDNAVLHVQSTEVDIHKTDLSWSHFKQNQQKKCGLVVTVFIVPSLDAKIVRNLESQLSGVSKAQLHAMIIYVQETETNYPYNDLVKVNFNVDDIILGDNKAIERSRSLCKQIQHMFEQKVVKVLEMMLDFNAEFIPRKPEDCLETLQDVVGSKLVKSLKDRYVVLDLSPENRLDDADKKPSDQELSRLAAAVGINWEKLAYPLGITATEIEDIRKLHQSMQSKILNMFYLWKKKDQNARLTFLLQLVENYSSVITTDMATVKAMKEEKAAALPDSDRDVIFHRKLLEFVTKKTKCDLCDLLSKKYGLSANLVNEFLSDGFYGYENKVAEILKTMSLPSWPQNKPDEVVNTCRKFAHTCSISLPGIITEVDRYIKAKREYLTIVKKLQFELEGLLLLTEVAIETHIPDLPKLSSELQYALLSIPEVYGCGIMWGDLTLHLTEELSVDRREQVRELLSTHKFTYGYFTQLIQPPTVEAGGYCIEQGSSLRAEKLNGDSNDKYSFGSIGCFVKIKSNKDKQGTQKLHCITCAHCVTDCRDLIEVQSGEQYEPFGETKYVEYKPDAIDIAAIEVSNRIKKLCELGLREAGIEETPFKINWSFNNGETVNRRKVFKFGSRTLLTCGLCMCDDYKTKEILENLNRNPKNNFDTDVNILIDVLPGAQGSEPETQCNEPRTLGNEPGKQSSEPGTQGSEPGAQGSDPATQGSEPWTQGSEPEAHGFSAKGDSGSVIYDADINEGGVLVLALLCGSISNKVTGKFMYSYASHIMKLKESLEKKHNISIEPACNK